MKKIFSVALIMLVSVELVYALKTNIDGIWYEITDQRVSVTYEGESYLDNEYSGSVVIPSSIIYEDRTYAVTSIGGNAFRKCSNLMSVTIPNSVIEIEKDAFRDCSGLKEVHISDIAAWCKILVEDSYSTPLSYAKHLFLNDSEITDLVIPDGVTIIGSYAFYCCSSISSVSIPNSVTNINRNAFYNCYGLKSIEIPEGVLCIGEEAFCSCNRLTSIKMPMSVTSIGKDAFSACMQLKKVHISDVAAWCNISFDNDLSNPLFCAKHLYLNQSEIKDLVIPDGVKSINSYAFCGCSSLTSVTMPNSVTSIGGSVFYGCSSITSPVYNSHIFAYLPTTYLGVINITEGIETIAIRAFYNCVGLTSVTIPNSVKNIGDGAFWGCSGLTSITIPNGITSIANGTFQSCYGLTSVSIPNSVTCIGDLAFYDCIKLIYVNIPENVISIGERAFYNCSSLKSITIPYGVTTIEKMVFYNCSSLKSITIPNGVTSIEYGAFFGCPNIKEIYNYATTPQVINSMEVFGGNNNYPVFKSICKLYVQKESIDLYKAADVWKEFENILPIAAEEVETEGTTVETTETTAEITWPEMSGAYTYELIIRDGNGNNICSLVFDSTGHLLTITFHAPRKDSALQQTQVTGFAFTVNGLTSGTTYTYELIAKDSDGNILNTESGSFTTKGDAPSAIEQATNHQSKIINKIIHDGQLFILRDGKTYTIQGQEVK